MPDAESLLRNFPDQLPCRAPGPLALCVRTLYTLTYWNRAGLSLAEGHLAEEVDHAALLSSSEKQRAGEDPRCQVSQE